ncbi:hypothetical protein CI109_105927 [Kwoniella shandongensis]|uniref:Transcription activator of gluconeogenesis ERT1 n=1 Tax=Kwoniella shandongensis TaxID=1734106 RepID=A0A5M6BQH5_9TREE|nr:uncharacterized protein CI109_006643 [Kwoniella shandongensis]KAA5525003.1 hypothetical protein CI109_006643 [Kwoniella shandongensis]
MSPQSPEYSAAVQRMQERQASWGRPGRSNSSGSMSSSLGSPSTSPHLLNLTALAPHATGTSFAAGSSGSGGSGGSANHSATGGNENSGRGRPKGKGKSKSKDDPEHKARKKVAKACLACQKSHLTCDEQRPCTRCVKKGIADQCVEGVRKKAKYLMEGEERAASRPSQTASLSPTSGSHSNLLPNVTLPSQPPLMPEPPRIPDDVWLAAPMQSNEQPSLSTNNGMPSLSDPIGSMSDPNRLWAPPPPPSNELPTNGFPYGGTAANNEYQMLDAMFASLSPIFPGVDPLDEAGRHLSMDSMVNSNNINTNQFEQSWLNPSPSAGSSATGQNPLNLQPTPSSSSIPQSVSPGPYSEISPNNQSSWGGWTSEGGQAMLDGSNQSQGQGGQESGQDTRLIPTQLRRVGKGLTPAEVYRTIVRPFDYTQGYHILIEYLTNNFEQPDILRVVRALASFRPSLIALQMPMSEDDEVFLERSFQRTLIELEKLISYSATPTAVWRRTGEVCYANPEFCKMVDRTDADLLVNKKYIYELFGKPSVVSYWENFSVHAFENTTQNFFQPITLSVGAAGAQLSCTCCFTIRRDFFDLPSVVIGQFLPIPADA